MGVVSAPSVFIQLKNLIVRVHSLSTGSYLNISKIETSRTQTTKKKFKKKLKKGKGHLADEGILHIECWKT